MRAEECAVATGRSSGVDPCKYDDSETRASSVAATMVEARGRGVAGEKEKSREKEKEKDVAEGHERRCWGERRGV